MQERGFTLVETMVVVLLLGVLLAMGAPTLEAYKRESAILGSGRIFKGEFLRVRSVALKRGANAAIKFDARSDGSTWYSCYVDGDFDGVLSDDIRRGIDERLCGPIRLDVPGAQRVVVGVLPGTKNIPPGTGTIDPADPIKFAYDTISFSPLGTATPGTFYLAGQGLQAAVRVVAGSARVRLFMHRGVRWEER